MANVQILGLKSLNRKLKSLPAAYEAAAIKALASAADEIVATMKGFCPVDQGDLRDSIGWTFGDAPEGARVVAQAKTRKGGKNIRLTIYAGNSKAFYARWIEFGTNAHEQGGKFAGTKHPGTVAQPFFFPAWRLKKKKVKSRVSREMNKAAKALAAS